MKLKKGDKVIVTLGKDRDKKGKIEKILGKSDSVIVSGINIFKRHLKPQQEGKKGGIVDLIKPLKASKVSLICPKCNQKTRIGFSVLKDEKLRICKKCKQNI